MAAMQVVGNGHQLPAHANVREHQDEYVIDLDVADFTETELAVELLGPRLTVRGEQIATREDDGQAFRLHERLEETFRLPDDAVLEELKVVFKHGQLEIRAPRAHLEPRRLQIEHPARGVNPDAEPC
jgi:HSP20 family molecular chaperone IbpA